MASKDNNVMTFPLSLPVELQLGIWALLDRVSLCNASLVCHAWHELSSDNHLWKELCRREIAGVEWTARALGRNHKSWKRHFGVRLRAADPYLAALRRVVPQLLADARARGATTETVAVCVKLYYDPSRDRRFIISKPLPHAIRHASSAKAGNNIIGIIGPDGLTVLCDQAAKLGVHYFDATHLRSFNKNRKAIKKWWRQHQCLYAHHEIIRSVPRLLGPQLNRMGKFPRLLPTDVPLAAVIEEHHRTARVALRKAPTLQVAVGHVGMSAEELIQNVTAFSAALAEVLPSADRVGSIALHATRGPSFTVISAPPPRL